LIFISSCLLCKAQNSLGNEWFVGIPLKKIIFNVIPQTSFLGVFDSTKYIDYSNSNICDSNGHLLLATDGIKLYDSNGEYIAGGGENINNDSIAWEYGFNSASRNGTIILPMGNSLYYVFTSTMSNTKCYNYFHNWNNDTFDFDEIRYSIIDMQANGGNGEIILRNKLLLHVDEYPWINKTNFTACRHANGRDWWLLKPSARMRQVIYKFLVTPDTIVTYKENLQLHFNIYSHDNRGQSCFNKDGNLYAECNQFGPHTIYDFDRCTGTLNFKRLIDLYPYKDTFGNSIDSSPSWSGLCFSPSGRFLYTCDFFNVYQIDLWESNNSLAIRRVSKDSDNNPLPFGHPNYQSMQLTPTNVIYLGNRHGISTGINGILYPDKLGDSCGFVFKYITSIYNTNDPPNMPFYGLGKQEGSPCDTIKLPVAINTIIKIYPNPTSDNLTIELPTDTKKARVIIYSMLGEVVMSQTREQVKNSKLEISVRQLAQALYSIRIEANGSRFIGKFVKE
jgi:hypothetical protein